MWSRYSPALAAVAVIASGHLASAASLRPNEASAGWILLFDGESLFGWTSLGRAAWRVEKGALTAESSDATTLRTDAVFADFELHAEFRVQGSAGIYLRIPASGKLQEANRMQLDSDDSENPPGSLTGEKKASRVAHSSEWSGLDVMVSGSHVTVRIDGQVAADATTSRSQIGSIGLYSSTGAKAAFRNIRLRPLNMRDLYNGNNLDGWKLAGPQDEQKPGSHKLLKMIPLPAHKETSAQWSVDGGLMHGAKGPGQIETQAVYDDFVLQFEVRDQSGKDPRDETNLVLRGQPGKFASGYESPLGNLSQTPAGSIGRLQKARPVTYTNGEFFTETVVARGRYVSIWVNGFPVTDFEDRRPSGQNLEREAKLGKGTIALATAGNSMNLDLRSVRIAELSEPPPPGVPNPPPSVSTVAPSLSPAPTTPPGAQAPAALPTAAPSPAPANNPVIEQLARQQAAEQNKQQIVGQLMQLGLGARNPEEQVRIYEQILKIDPANQVAFNARKEARDKIDTRDQEAAKASQRRQQEERQTVDREAAEQRALAEAERALVRGDLRVAQANVASARKLAPQDPDVQRLSEIINNRFRVRSRVRLLVFGGCAAGGLLSLLMLIRRMRHQTPYLVMAEGLEKDKQYILKTQVTRIGAVAQESGLQNDIVIRDLEHSISRFHCEIHQVKGKLYLLDCNSANGTYLNGRKLRPERPERFGRGSRIGLGRSCSLTVEYRGSKS